jgi:hypothetical protein
MPFSLLETWEAGVEKRTSGRALVLLAGAAAEGRDAAALLPVGRRDASLLDLRRRLFGSRYTGISSCPSCGHEIELSFDDAEVRRDVGQAGTVPLRVDGVEVAFRLPTGEDLAAIEPASDVATGRAMLLARCIVATDRAGEAIAVDRLPPPVVEAVVARMAELDPQADVSFELECPACSHRWLEPFDIATFLWTEVADAARRLLADVHALASAYGWSEHHILSLTPRRRNAYLEMLQ